MNAHHDPNLNYLNSYDTCDIFQMGFSEPDIQIGFELSNFDYPKTIDCESDTICNENFNELGQSINCCERLFDNRITLNEDCLSHSEEKTTSVITGPKPNEQIHSQGKFKIWKCKYNCGKIFTQEKYMNAHTLVMHENAKMISCQICFVHLSTESRLKYHMLRHSKVKHLICLICLNKRTKELSCMRHHILKKHNISYKHSLFKEAYYQMSLKEIAMENKSEGNCTTEKGGTKSKVKKTPICLQEKLIEKAKLISDKLKSFSKDMDERKIENSNKKTDALGAPTHMSKV